MCLLEVLKVLTLFIPLFVGLSGVRPLIGGMVEL
jgi:hypothetical protein